MTKTVRRLSLVEKSEKQKVVDTVVDKLRFLYDNWDREDLRWILECTRKQSDLDRKAVWSNALHDASPEAILTTFNLVARGETEFNRHPPTPMEFAAACRAVEAARNGTADDTFWSGRMRLAQNI